jgi:hypothetical protein
MAEGQQPDIQPDRLPYDVELYKRADEFCQSALKALPELAGIAIVPVWSTAPKDVPSGLLRLRNPQPPYANTMLLTLLKRLAAFSVEIHSQLVQQFAMYDQYAAELTKQINIKREELDQLETSKDTDKPENG